MVKDQEDRAVGNRLPRFYRKGIVRGERFDLMTRGRGPGWLLGLLLVLSLASFAIAAPVSQQAPRATPKLTPATAPLVVARPDVVVKNIQVVPAQPKTGEYFEVRIELINQGKAATGPGQQCIIDIEPSGFTPAPSPVQGIITPNKSFFLVKKYVFMEAGNYKVLARPIPGPKNAVVKPFTVVLAATGSQPAPVPQLMEGVGTSGGNNSSGAGGEAQTGKLQNPGTIRHFDPQPEPPRPAQVQGK